MEFRKTKLPGVFEIYIEAKPDERGFFARTWCQKEFESRGLTGKFVQASLSFNERKGTLRGLHYQIAPYEETKLIRCTQGAIYDVARVSCFQGLGRCGADSREAQHGLRARRLRARLPHHGRPV